MARAYAGRGIGDFARALWQRWEDGDAQTEGRPDAEADAVSIITIHSAKGLEWPIVIPINSTTLLWSDMSFLYRRRDDSVHFRVFDFPSFDYEAVSREETEALRRERVRLWYVALTRARDLLLLPKQNERIGSDWLSLINLDINALPLLDGARFRGLAPQPVSSSGNAQDVSIWEREAAAIAAAQWSISWHQPSRHEGAFVPIETSDDVFVGAEAILESLPAAEKPMIQGGRERGLVLHKLMEEVLTGEIADDVATLQARACELLTQLGIHDAEDAATGRSSREMASVAHRTLDLPEIAELRPKLLPEFRVYAAAVVDQTASLTAGIADAVVIEAGRIEAVIDWKSDVNPTAADIEMYRRQVRDYLKATGAALGLIVFLTSGRVQRVQSTD
jgi:ATP-dependent exoDNAse (exonuclease V) beta subunit